MPLTQVMITAVMVMCSQRTFHRTTDGLIRAMFGHNWGWRIWAKSVLLELFVCGLSIERPGETCSSQEY